jgi:tetratricopeptide (TPR) repeat protein
VQRHVLGGSEMNFPKCAMTVLAAFAVMSSQYALAVEDIATRKARLQRENAAEYQEGFAAYSLLKYDDAIAKMTSVIDRNALSASAIASAHEVRALSLIAKKDCKSAVPDLLKSVEIKGETAESLATLSYCYGENGDRVHEANLLDKAITLAPENAAFRRSRCVMKFNAKDYAGALPDCEFASKAKPDDVGMLEASGQSAEMLKQNDKAKAFYQSLLRLKPDSKTAIEGLKRVGG